ncbi:uncharacterized protein LOC110836344 [Zootermopsis nevadensis]|nr:uncharacterized protein LOC110836344 [Zootermopsis nevadensis]
MTIQPSSVETKDNEVFKLRRSSRSITRKVRFEGAGDNSAKGVQPLTVTPYISHSQRPKQRISLLGSLEVSSPVATSLPSGDLICFDSPVSVPRRVMRRSLRLSSQVQN